MEFIIKTILEKDFTLQSDAYKELLPLITEYPGFKNWYWNTVVPGLSNGTRNIVICQYISQHKCQIAGVLITKNDGIEKKLCTLRVNKQFQRNGIGQMLLSEAQQILRTDKPLVTVSGHRLHEFKSLFDRFGFIMEGEYSDLYRNGSAEYSFNGILYVPTKEIVLPRKIA